MTSQKGLKALPAGTDFGWLNPKFNIPKKEPFCLGRPIGQSIQGFVDAIHGSRRDLPCCGQGRGRPDAEDIKDQQTQDDPKPAKRMLWGAIRVFPCLVLRFCIWCVHAVRRRYDGQRRISI